MQAVSIPEKSIAVLPFENLSDNKENAYFADGVQDEILTNLAKIADLKVISRTSVMQYKTDTSRNSREIGKQLGVAHLLEGSVRRVGNQVRVNAQLIDTRTDARNGLCERLAHCVASCSRVVLRQRLPKEVRGRQVFQWIGRFAAYGCKKTKHPGACRVFEQQT